MKKGKFGFILTDEVYKKLNSLARANKKKPYDYIIDMIQKEYNDYISQKLKWDLEND
jgi:hypothetical protein